MIDEMTTDGFDTEFFFQNAIESVRSPDRLFDLLWAHIKSGTKASAPASQ